MAAWFAAIGPIVFKVGIGADPDHRFWNPEFGYEAERTWHFMDVVWCGPANECRQLEIDVWCGPANECRQLEIYLIYALRGLPGCRTLVQGGWCAAR